MNSHLRGYRGHATWRHQPDIDRDLPGIISQWQTTVLSLRWSSPGEGPRGWRTARLLDVHHLSYCPKRLLQLRREISRHAAHLELLRDQGRIVRVMKSTLQEDSELFNLESLTIPGEGTLTDHWAVHNLVSDHFMAWFQEPEGLDAWLTRAGEPVAFRHYTYSKSIPADLSNLLWRALTDVPGASQVRTDLTAELAFPPTLGEFNGAIEGHRGSTTPGASGLTYNMVKGWPAPFQMFAHHRLVALWGTPETLSGLH